MNKRIFEAVSFLAVIIFLSGCGTFVGQATGTTGNLYVASSPSNASVSLDGITLGNTPPERI